MLLNGVSASQSFSLAEQAGQSALTQVATSKIRSGWTILFTFSNR